ncbi:unnamed protein product [Phyllotreta striolata]|uniref:Uncharacterized protein n=2 Tax=Phyllotreta striolata TaxID=444603 RepID=A0A9N9TH07_PHYSR|nr:unnamed protein product [Phyllotreta striolata]
MGGGKLFRKYYNLRRDFKTNGLLRSKACRRTADAAKKPITKAEQEVLEWLKNNAAPWQELEAKWAETYEARKSYFMDVNSIHDYMKTFKGLNEPLGYVLLEYDFATQYPYLNNRLLTAWPEFSKKISKYASTLKIAEVDECLNFFDNDNLSEDSKTMIVLKILSYLIKPVLVVKKKNKSSFKPSRIEMLDGLILHVTAGADIHASLERKRAL